MALEIERKFLVNGDDWKTSEPIRFCQGYLNRDKERTVRVRLAGDAAYLTIKGLNEGAVRQEYEYPIPIEDAQELLKLCEQPLIEKRRHIVPYSGFEWEVDEFLGANEGLVVAEIELDSEDQAFEKPDWIAGEVTDDARYFNSQLSRNPFANWKSS